MFFKQIFFSHLFFADQCSHQLTEIAERPLSPLTSASLFWQREQRKCCHCQLKTFCKTITNRTVIFTKFSSPKHICVYLRWKVFDCYLKLRAPLRPQWATSWWESLRPRFSPSSTTSRDLSSRTCSTSRGGWKSAAQAVRVGGPVVDYFYAYSMGSTRFLKVARAKSDEGLVVVKVFVKHDPSLPLEQHLDKIEYIKKNLANAVNCLPFQRVLVRIRI